MIKAVIVEDEIHGIENLKNLLREYCPGVEVIGEAKNNQEAQKLLTDAHILPDVAFLDINLEDGNVFQTLQGLNGDANFDIIFITAFNEYAVEAFNYSAIGYVLKPIDPDELKKAVQKIRPGNNNKIKERIEVFQQRYPPNNHPNAFEKMSISALDGIYFINIKDIIRCEAEDNYTHIFLRSGERITASKTIKSYEELLSGVNFYRVHKSHLINLNYMRKFVKGDGGYLIMDDDKRIEVSRRRRAAFMLKINELQDGI
jgi:two-component system LytT family response regulator